VSYWMRKRGWTRPAVPSHSKRFAAAGRDGVLAAQGDRRGRPYAHSVRAEARTLWEGTRLSTALIGRGSACVRPRWRAGRRRMPGSGRADGSRRGSCAGSSDRSFARSSGGIRAAADPDAVRRPLCAAGAEVPQLLRIISSGSVGTREATGMLPRPSLL
jgi:hypothetical protein